MLQFVTSLSIVGCGGIGSWLLAPLLRFLEAEGFVGEITLWDGDHFSASNASRQDMSRGALGRPKAESLAEKFRQEFRNLRIWHRNEYVTTDNVATAVTERSLVISCVDNHPARSLLARHAESLRNVCIISAGNERFDGNVCVSLRRTGRDLTTSVVARHPEIARSTAGDRAQMGCEQLIQQGESQLLVTNFLAAAAILSVFHILWSRDREGTPLARKIVPQEVFFDAQQCAMTLVPAQ